MAPLASPGYAYGRLYASISSINYAHLLRLISVSTSMTWHCRKIFVHCISKRTQNCLHSKSMH